MDGAYIMSIVRYVTLLFIYTNISIAKRKTDVVLLLKPLKNEIYPRIYLAPGRKVRFDARDHDDYQRVISHAPG